MQRHPQTRRATDMETVAGLMSQMLTPEGIGQGLGFQPQPSDVIIAPYGKCGTTWLQQTVHGLRTRGDMDFDDISRVVPWIEPAADCGIDLEAEQKARPRAFKSHLGYDLVPKGCRYIVSLRDPRDAMVSLYHFFENWFFEAGSISLEEFAHQRYFRKGEANPEGGDYWSHFSSWWAQRDNPNVLLLAYENMKQDFAGTIDRIAGFLDIPLDEQLRELVLHQSSMEFMLTHKDRFDDLIMRQRSAELLGLPTDSDSAKVREGRVGAHKVALSDELIAEFDEIWAATIAADHGLASYRQALDLL